MAETSTSARPAHYGHHVWQGEDGEYFYLNGHVANRRAIAAANRYARVECGMRSLYGEETPPAGLPMVSHLWFRPDPERADDTYWAPCEPTDDGAEPYTEVSL